MTRLPDFTPGVRFARLVVLCRAANGNDGRSRYECRCDCGAHTTVVRAKLTNGHTRSCGCLHRESVARIGREYGSQHVAKAQAGNITHGMTRTPTWESWTAMRRRCLEPSAINYADYGGRGISVCAGWLGIGGFAQFLADMGARPEGKTLDRRDPDGNYEPSNCRWATPLEQRHNRRKVAMK